MLTSSISVPIRRGQLTNHLIPFFGRHPLREIDRKLVNEFRTFKLAQRDRLAERIEPAQRPVAPTLAGYRWLLALE